MSDWEKTTGKTDYQDGKFCPLCGKEMIGELCGCGYDRTRDILRYAVVTPIKEMPAFYAKPAQSPGQKPQTEKEEESFRQTSGPAEKSGQLSGQPQGQEKQSEQKAEDKGESSTGNRAESSSGTKDESGTGTRAESKTESKTENRAERRAESKTKTEGKTESKTKSRTGSGTETKSADRNAGSFGSKTDNKTGKTSVTSSSAVSVPGKVGKRKVAPYEWMTLAAYPLAVILFIVTNSIYNKAAYSFHSSNVATAFMAENAFFVLLVLIAALPIIVAHRIPQADVGIKRPPILSYLLFFLTVIVEIGVIMICLALFVNETKSFSEIPLMFICVPITVILIGFLLRKLKKGLEHE